MSTHIRNAGRHLHKAHLKRKIARIEQEQAMDERTTTDEVIDVVVETAREGIRSLTDWGRRVRSSLETYIEEEEAQKRRSAFEVIDGDKPRVYDGEIDWEPGDTMAYVDGAPTRVPQNLSVHHPTITIMRPVTAQSFAESRDLLEQEVAAMGYTVVRHPSVR